MGKSVVTYTTAKGTQSKTVVTDAQKSVLAKSGRLVADHGKQK